MCGPFRYGNLFEAAANVHRRRGQTRLGSPRDGTIQRPIHLEDTGSTAEAVQATREQLRQPVTCEACELFRRDITQGDCRTRQLCERIDSVTDSDLGPAGAKARRERLGDRSRASACHRPSDGVRERAEQQRKAGATCLSGVMALSMVALAQSGQPPTQPPAEAGAPAAQEMKAPAQPVTIVGCVHKEADYGSAKNLGKGGVVGTGVGADNEFVLINASTPAAVGTPPAPVGTSGAVGNEEYEMTGSSEGQLTSFVGKRVEITGTLKAAETKPTGATGGVTEAVPGSRDLKLREVEVMSVKEAMGTCPALAP